MPGKSPSIQIGTPVTLTLSKAPGVVIGAAWYLEHGPQVLVRHIDARGDQVEKWYDESAVIRTATPIGASGQAGS